MKKDYLSFLIYTLLAYLLVSSCITLHKIGWGTGNWWGEYSLKWFSALAVFVVMSICILLFARFWIWERARTEPIVKNLVLMREKLGNGRWVVAFILFIAPVWVFQYTTWGVVLGDFHIRLVIWGMVVLALAFLAHHGNALWSWKELLVALLLTSSEFVIAVTFMNVVDYPFSLGWSEGNRIWDYSVMFGRRLYDFPADQEIFVHLDLGRQFVGGLPFIFPGLTIQAERFWIALTFIIPYLLLGFAIFRFSRRTPQTWLLGALWVLIFLKQGPIHPPLILYAAVVAMLWGSPLWLALPVIMLTGYAAETSRFTWVFAPGMWIGMLELAGAALQDNKLSRASWVRAISLGAAGFVGGQFGQKVVGLLTGDLNVGVATSVNSIIANVSTPIEPLLWYRLLPNATYGIGILVSLLIAVLPLVILLTFLFITKKWSPNGWQAFSVLGPLLAFLVVGLIVSTKVGGGGDLHNMDMFLIGLVFSAVIALRKSGMQWFTDIGASPVYVKLTMILLFAVPGVQSWREMRSFDFGEDVPRLLILLDDATEKSLDMYPSDVIVDRSIAVIREEVALARRQGGDVLFLDQRQLLTFGYVTGVPLVPEYEKKLLMTQALAADANYFQNFYDDLAVQRFSLIVSEPLRSPVKDSSFHFGEENNAWVTWVSNPVLCYYEAKVVLKEVGVELLVPRESPADCEAILP